MKQPDENPFDHMRLDSSHCFLCGVDMGSSATEEHIFPKWLQQKYDLWSQTIHLLNETKIQYKDLKVPCCADCNNKHLSKLENEICGAVSSGYEAVTQIDEFRLYQWAAKLYYGILRKELTLKYDRRDLESSTILTESDLENFKMMHFIMQSIRRPTLFTNGNPFSVLIANLHANESIGLYDFRDNLLGHTVKVKLGEIGIIVCFEDGAINENSYGNYLRKVDARKLHPLQFDELFARVIYQNSLIHNQLSFILAMPKDEAMPISISMVGSVVVGERNQKDFAVFFWEFCKFWFEANDLTFDDIFKPPNLVASWISDIDGQPIYMNSNGDIEK